MTEQSKPANLVRLLLRLQQQEEAQRQPAPAAGMDPKLALLREWQTNRLAQTYSDLLSSPEYGPAGRFFLSDIYAPRDFSQRDQDFQRLYELLSRFLPEQSLALLRDTLAVNRLSHELDQSLLRVLVEQLGMVDQITAEMYAEAYRLCDNYDERLLQIEQIGRIIRQVGQGARLPAVGLGLRLARRPARAAGWFELYDFLERGYAAFKPMKDVEPFARVIEERETRILNRIYQGFTHQDEPV